ncbi:hypothetical protein ACWC3X_43005 [Streptomyces populi]
MAAGDVGRSTEQVRVTTEQGVGIFKAPHHSPVAFAHLRTRGGCREGREEGVGDEGERGRGSLEQGLATAGLGGVCRSLAVGIDRDHDAVIAGLTMPWNSGVVEGHVNRIKMLRRQMSGRAGFDLLRKRVLMA